MRHYRFYGRSKVSKSYVSYILSTVFFEKERK
uniref:Uncharacterized protein n=1 Tax=Anguilla anguilla TaxID=7936 RepID=A0A0E9SP25_ANGAN